MLVLLPTDHNKLLMQWKGPFEVSSVAGLNDYKVKVKGKEKVYHANLLKKYFEREETTVEGEVACWSRRYEYRRCCRLCS